MAHTRVGPPDPAIHQGEKSASRLLRTRDLESGVAGLRRSVRRGFRPGSPKVRVQSAYARGGTVLRPKHGLRPPSATVSGGLACEILHERILELGTRAVRLDALRRLTEEVFGDAERADRWLRREQRILGGRTPLDCAKTAEGAEEVRQFLMRIAHGVFS